MSRSNYSDDYGSEFAGELNLYRANVGRAISGKRGQKFLRDLIDALDALPAKRLITNDLDAGGSVCAIGSVGLKRGIDMSKLNPEDAPTIGKVFGIAECMAREVVFENDEGAYWNGRNETSEERWQRMRDWAARLLK